MRKIFNYKRLWVVLGIFIFVLIGCGNKTDTEQPDLNDVASNQLIEVDFYKMFDYDVHETLHFSGTGEYYRTDTIERIDDIKQPTTYRLYIFERNVDDMSGGFNGDTSSTFNLKISDENVSIFYKEGIEEILLQKPLSVGNMWETQRLDPMYGFIDVEAKITEINETGEIIVTYTSSDDYIPEDDFSRILTLRFSTLSGLVEETIGNPDLQITRKLVKSASSPESNYVSKYINPDEDVAKFYYEDEISSYVEDGLRKAWVFKENPTDSEIYTSYETYLSKLDSNDFRNISRAKSVLLSYMSQAEDDFELVEKFANFYEWTIGGLNAEMINLENLDPLDAIFSFYDYNGETNQMYVIPSSEQSNPTFAAVSNLLFGNGVGMIVSEGFPYIRTDVSYLMRTVPMTSNLIEDYVQYKTLQYEIFPLYTEGYLIRSPEEITTALSEFERLSKSHSSESAFEDAAYYADYFFTVLVIPTAYEMDGKYDTNGYIYDIFLEAYKDYVQKYPDSKYNNYLSKVIQLLSSHQGKYTNELSHYLSTIGYEADNSFMADALQQSTDFKGIERVTAKDLPERKQTLKVSDINALIEAIQPNTEIILSPGLYTIPYLDIRTDYVTIENGTLKIHDITGLTIVASGLEPSDLVSESYYEVLEFQSVSDIRLENLRIGHTYKYCVGDVIEMKNSKDIYFNNLILFGCGYNGLNLSYVDQLNILNSLISDCQASAIYLDHVSGLNVENSAILRNGEQVLRFYNGTDILFKNVDILKNEAYMYETGSDSGLVLLSNTPQIIFDNVNMEVMSDQNVITGDGVIQDLNGEILEY